MLLKISFITKYLSEIQRIKNVLKKLNNTPNLKYLVVKNPRLNPESINLRPSLPYLKIFCDAFEAFWNYRNSLF